MLALGCHLSISGGYEATVRTAHSIGANTFAFFTRNPRGSQARPEDAEDAAKAVKRMQELSFAPVHWRPIQSEERTAERHIL